MKGAPRVLVLTVNFRQPECTLQFLDSISLLRAFDQCRVLVVDNDSSDGSVDRLRPAIAKLPNVGLLVSAENRGYFGAAKWGFHQYLTEHPFPDWVIVCNNDIVFDSPEFLINLRGRDPQTEGVLAPMVISSLTGHDSNPMIVTKPGPMRLLRYRFLLSTYSIAWLTQRLAPFVRRVRHRVRLGKAHVPSRQSIYAPHGAMIIFSRNYFETGGTIEDGSFLFAEEFSVAETCSRLGLPVVHDSTLMVRHNENQTTGRRLSRDMYRHQREGLHHAIRTYFQPRRPANPDATSTTADLI